MILSKLGLPPLTGKTDFPGNDYFKFPVKVLQFGTGVLLRGLPDYFIDKANKQDIFKGRVAIIKSTSSGNAEDFADQDGLYTICVRGIEKGAVVDENHIIGSVAKVYYAADEWSSILEFALSPDLEIVISNTTEVGLMLLDKDDIFADPPISFPGKLLAILYHRYIKGQANSQKGLVIIPTELIPGNADKLKDILITLSEQNKLSREFIDWMVHKNYFCNSLVDRIVPGKLNFGDKLLTQQLIGYEDNLMIMAEPYRLWAIETGEPIVREILSFSKSDEGVIIAKDITKFRELKLRLLNGTHTLSCGLAVLSNFTTVKDAMKQEFFKTFIQMLMLQEIVPAITGEKITIDEAKEFSERVIERFSNPFIDHQWMSITLQYTAKMLMRNVPILQAHYLRSVEVPQCIALGFAGYILFMRSRKNEEHKYVGSADGTEYLISDNKAELLFLKWNEEKGAEVASAILSDKEIWNTDLSSFPGFTEAVTKYLELIIKNGATMTMKALTHSN
jgi:tagaturonate reductase